MPCAMQVTTRAGATGAGAESVRLENAMPVLPLCPTLVRVRARAGLGLGLECVRVRVRVGVRVRVRVRPIGLELGLS